MKIQAPKITLATVMWQTIVMLPIVVLNVLGQRLIIQYYIGIAVLFAGEIAGILIAQKKNRPFAPEIGAAAAQLLFAAAVICSYLYASASSETSGSGENYSGLAIYYSLILFWLPDAIIAIIVFIVKYLSKKRRFTNADYSSEDRIKPYEVWFAVLHTVMLGTAVFENALVLWSAPNIHFTEIIVIINLIFCKRKYIGHILGFIASVGVILINFGSIQGIFREEPEHAKAILIVNISAAAVLGIYNLAAFIIKLVKSRKSSTALDKPL